MKAEFDAITKRTCSIVSDCLIRLFVACVLYSVGLLIATIVLVVFYFLESLF